MSPKASSQTDTSSLRPAERPGTAARAASTGSAVEPSAAIGRLAFGAAWPRACRYAELLRTTAVERGLLGPREGDRIWERHLLNCAAVAELVPTTGNVADLGSGAGLPGVVVALLRPDLHLVLVEPMRRRARFLRECTTALGLDQVEVAQARAEQLANRSFDMVLARAVAPLPRLLPLALPMLRPGGSLLALKGASAREELAASGPALAAAGARSAVRRCGQAWLRPPATVLVVRSASVPWPSNNGRRAGHNQ